MATACCPTRDACPYADSASMREHLRYAPLR